MLKPVQRSLEQRCCLKSQQILNIKWPIKKCAWELCSVCDGCSSHPLLQNQCPNAPSVKKQRFWKNTGEQKNQHDDWASFTRGRWWQGKVHLIFTYLKNVLEYFFEFLFLFLIPFLQSHYESSKVVSVEEVFLPSLYNGGRFQQDFFYVCPTIPATYNLASISKYNSSILSQILFIIGNLSCR